MDAWRQLHAATFDMQKPLELWLYHRFHVFRVDPHEEQDPGAPPPGTAAEPPYAALRGLIARGGDPLVSFSGPRGYSVTFLQLAEDLLDEKLIKLLLTVSTPCTHSRVTWTDNLK